MKTKIAISLDPDVLRFIDSQAAAARLERSAFINQHFAQLMPPADISADKPAPKRLRKGQV